MTASPATPPGADNKLAIEADPDWVTSTARARQWILAHLDDFDPFDDDGGFKITRSKSINELAIMLYGHVRLTGDRDSEDVQRILLFLQTVHRNRGFRDRLMRFPIEFPLVAGLFAVLRLLGDDDPEQRLLLQRFIDAGLLEYTERVPHRLMDVRMTLEWADLPHSMPGMDALYASTILARAPSALHLHESAAYALTHVILFVFGFGADTDAPASFLDTQGLRETLTMLTVIYCQERHWDLLAEVLFCWDCIGLAPSMTYARGWTSFLEAQLEDGAFPGPERPSRAHQPDGEQRDVEPEHADSDYFWTNYHTTLVGIMAGTLRSARTNGVLTPSATNLNMHASDAPAPGTSAEDWPAAYPDAIGRAAQWLEHALDKAEHDDGMSQAACCYILVGLWICDSVLGNDSLDGSGIPHRVWQALLARDAQPDGPPAALRVIAAALLSRWGFTVPSIHTFTDQAAEVLRAMSAGNAIEDLPLCEKRVLLHALGLHPEPAAATYADVIDVARAFPLTGSGSTLDELLLRIESHAGYGTHRVTVDDQDLWIQDLLAGLAMHAFRKYDVVGGCRLLRAMGYLGVAHGENFNACLRFILLHQRPEGAFGFLGPEEAVLKHRAPVGYSLDANLYLPVTVSVLVALAEGHDQSWRLYDRLPRPGASMTGARPSERLAHHGSERERENGRP